MSPRNWYWPYIYDFWFASCITVNFLGQKWAKTGKSQQNWKKWKFEKDWKILKRKNGQKFEKKVKKMPKMKKMARNVKKWWNFKNVCFIRVFSCQKNPRKLVLAIFIRFLVQKLQQNKLFEGKKGTKTGQNRQKSTIIWKQN